MADDEIQTVKLKMGPLMTFGLVLWIIIGVIILLAMVLGAIALITIAPKIASTLGTLGALSNLGGGAGGLGGNPGGGGGLGGGNQSNNSTQNYLRNLMIQMHTDADQGNWSGATNDLNTIKSIISSIPSSQLPNGTTQIISSLDQAITSRNQTAVDAIFNQLSQSGMI